MTYKFLGTEYEKFELMPILKQNIDFLVESQKLNVKQLVDLKPNLEKVLEVFENDGMTETPEEKEKREKMETLSTDLSQKTFDKVMAKRREACLDFNSFVAAVERDIISVRKSNSAVDELLKLLDDYLTNKKYSMLLALVHRMDDYIDKDQYLTCYDCYVQAYNHFLKEQ